MFHRCEKSSLRATDAQNNLDFKMIKMRISACGGSIGKQKKHYTSISLSSTSNLFIYLLWLIPESRKGLKNDYVTNL